MVRILGADHVIVGSENGGRWLGGSDRQLRALMLSPFTSQTLTTLICSENTQDLQALTELIQSGQVRPVIDRTYPLSQAPEAIQYLRDGHGRGQGRRQPLRHKPRRIPGNQQALRLA